ncbi:hypothetical protein BGW36DRAFT_350167 [Talaromyces proteolyticus]|uniref:ER-bound oxygenase mpaB/mpaB'/Rubber oxygenase catalytic domain-containing protein n=1 Tax=Talaromyces proteolyticus TaxID=1131652 RepID=A0AAD4KFU1_9EURO|nr:uncharacterized protein BGW36DRAFT_350167 [Talaromyces proteolyticus]KAH8690686.1 hypothetical protein BGW36DRAFT_350167 [Talaromyces proteolyticus]
MHHHPGGYFAIDLGHLSRSWNFLQSPESSPILFISLAFIAYLILIRHCRYSRSARHVRLFSESQVLDRQEMPLPVAQKIYDSLMHAEFPFWFWKGIELALFRTYGIPTISSQLAKTSRLVAPDALPRRYVETEVLFLEFALRQWGTVPWLQAMARTRAIHAAYRKSGSVKEEDMLYTLASLATQPVLLVEKLEWRSLNEVELTAVGTLYRAIGDALSIDYTLHLQPFIKKEGTGQNGLDFYSALRDWQVSYETREMVYTPQNKLLCDAAVGLLLWGVPGKSLKRFITTALTTIMDDLLREAMGFPPTPYWIASITKCILATRKMFLRHLCPPRPDLLKKKVRVHGPSVPNTIMRSYVAAPYFVEPTVWNRWFSLGTWWWWALGLPIPGKDSAHQPEGYYIPALGPPLGRTVASQRREEKKVKAVGLSKGWQYL